MTILKAAAAEAAILAWALAGPVTLMGVITGLFPQKLWQLARQRARRDHG